MISPELIHPLEAEEAPLILPGMEVTEPDDCQFFFYGNYEGFPGCDHRSTVWNIQKRRAMREKHRAKYQASQTYFVQGAHGFSQ